jgi:predicted nucleic acid-binding Zn ribbon protein
MKNGPVAISQAMEAVLRGLGSGRMACADSLSEAWSKAVGEKNIKHTRPADIKDGVLIVHVDSSAWLHKLTMEKIQILSKIKEELGEDVIRDIKLRIGEI